MSTAYDVAQYLDAQGVGDFAGDSGWTIATAWEPASPDDAITIYDTGGEAPDTDELDLQPAFQVRVRSRDYLTAMTKQAAIRDLLIVPASVTMNGTLYHAVFMTSEILSIGRDENDRFLLTANYRAIKERT